MRRLWWSFRDAVMNKKPPVVVKESNESMRNFPVMVASRVCVIGACVGLLLLCSCASVPIWFANDSIRPPLPAETSFNKGAGRGDLLYLMLHLESGEELLLAVDTGLTHTVLDKSLEPILGKRLGTRRISWAGERKTTAGVYKAPKLYLGNTALLTGDRILTDDVSSLPFPGRPQRGILGMDCLRHYCIQLDFAAGKMRFLDPDHLANENLGKPFPLKIFLGQVFTPENLLGVKGKKSQIDTGCTFDGTLKPKLLRRKLREPTTFETNAAGTFHKGVWGGETYTNLMLNEYGCNLVGLRFLGRHKVTLNFPKRKMYLQRTSVGPLEFERSSTNVLGSTLGWWEAEGMSPSGDDKESLAARILSAPNLRPGAPDALSKGFSWDPPRLISVGPPEAKLRVVHMPPGNYRMKVVSEVERGAEFLPDYNRLSSVPMQEEGTILLLHDYNYQKEHMVPWAWVLAQAGYHVVLVDLRGHGDSSGQIVSYGKYETADMRQVLDHLLKQQVCDSNLGVLGVGYGANLALHWAAQDPRVRTVVAIAPHNQLEQTFERLARERKASLSPDVLQDALGLVAARLDIKWADWSGEAAARQLKEPVLLIGGGKDTVTSTNDLKALEQAAPAGSKVLLVPEANHRDIAYWFHEIEEPVKAWFHAHLPLRSDGQTDKAAAAQKPVGY